MTGPTRRTLLQALRGLLALSAAGPFAPARAVDGLSRPARVKGGVNLAGAEFGTRMPGVHGSDYTYPEREEILRLQRQGFGSVRLPFRWERLSPQLYGPLDEKEWRRLSECVATAAAAGVELVLDVHNYAARHVGADGFVRPHRIGTREVPTASLAWLWAEIARRTRHEPHVVYGLMNEPAEIDAAVWLATANEAIAAIRATGARNLILVPGVDYSGAHSWYRAGNTVLAEVYDPAGNIAIEVHQYLDTDSSGRDPLAVSSTIGSERIEAFQEWARSRGFRAFLGELGTGTSPLSLAALEDLLTEVHSNPDVWIGWAGWAAGRWWPDDYPLKLDPDRDGRWPAHARAMAAFARSGPPGPSLGPRPGVALDLARGRWHGVSHVAEAIVVSRDAPAMAPGRDGRLLLFAAGEARLTDLGLTIEAEGVDLLAAASVGSGGAALHRLAPAGIPGPDGAHSARRLAIGADTVTLEAGLAEPGWHTFAVYVHADPLAPSMLRIGVGDAEAELDLAACEVSFVSRRAVGAIAPGGDWRRISLSFAAAAAGTASVRLMARARAGPLPRPAAAGVDIAMPTLELGAGATHYLTSRRPADVALLATPIARRLAAGSATLLIETRGLSAAPVSLPVLSCGAVLILGRSARGGLESHLAEPVEGGEGTLESWQGKRRWAVAIDPTSGEVHLAASSLAPTTVALADRRLDGAWMLGGLGSRRLNGCLTRLAVIDEALTPRALSELVA